MLRILSEKKLHHFYNNISAKTFSVLFERENEDGIMHGFTENYIKVKTPFDASLFNRLTKAELCGIDDDGCVTCDPYMVNKVYV